MMAIMAGFGCEDGWASDDSSFYGDDEVRQHWRSKAARPLKRHHQPAEFHVPRKRIKSTRASDDSNVKPEPKSDQEDVTVLKSRPHFANQDTTATETAGPIKSSMLLTSSDENNADFVVEPNRFEGCAGAWQHDEAIEDFLSRAPVTDPSTATHAGWLWVESPKRSFARQSHHKQCAPAAFIQQAGSLLHEYVRQNARLLHDAPGIAQAALTRKMTTHRDHLGRNLLALAKRMRLTSGKWMLFPGRDDLARVWRAVATATSQGRLGPTAKSALYDPSSGDTVICVYTNDFTDRDDVCRVLHELAQLGLVHSDGKPLCYKCDAYTHIGINSKNEYKLKASLYSSKELLMREDRVLDDGPVARLSKSSRKIDDFSSMFSDDIS